MATIDNYKIKIEVDGADQIQKAEKSTINLEKQITNLGNKVLGLNASFQKLATGGLSLLIGSALRMADQMQDLADATGLTAGYVNAFSESIVQAGGKSDDAAKLLRTFYDNLNDMAEGSDTAERALAKVNITFEDLRNLTEKQLLEKAIEQLANMEAGAQRTAAGVKIFGKAFAEIDPATLERILQTKNIDAMDAALKKAADTAQTFQTNLKTLQNATIGLLTNMIGDTDKMTVSFAEAAKVAKFLITTLAYSYFISLAASLIPVIVNMMKLAKAMREVAIAMRLAQAAGGLLILVLGAAAAAFAYFSNQADDALEKLIKQQEQFNNTVSDLKNVPMSAIKSYSDGIKLLQKQLKDGLITQDEFNKKAEELSNKTKSPGAFGNAGPLTAEQIQQQTEVANQIKIQNQFLVLQNSLALEHQGILSDTIGMDEDRAEKIKALAEIEKNATAQILGIQEKITNEFAKGEETNLKLVEELANQKVIIEQNAEKLKSSKIFDLDRLNAIKAQNAEYEIQLQKQKALIDDAKAQAEAELRKQVISGELSQQQLDDELSYINIATSHAEKLAELRKQLQTAVTEDQRKQIEEQITMEAERAAKAIDIKTKEIEDRKALEESYIAGINDALSDISKQFEPYKMAQDAILMTWDKIGNAVDEFVQTGKFKFSDFAKSVLRDLAAMIIKAQILFAIKKTLGFFGISLPGLAEGGPAKGGQPYIVGEKGPELFVPKQAGTVIPNNKLSATTEATATGKVNAPVTNNYITNNINALDAKSVAQLFAENRKTLLGVTETARREMAYGM